jgi:hypothetical protein
VCHDGGTSFSEKVRQTPTHAQFMSFSSHALELD